MNTNNPFISEFQDAYDNLNKAQRSAVDKIYGPVMVIAGPGTGKTQLLAVRVCNIIQNAAVSAHNILCLTYTDAGVHAMRNRLIKFLGADAYQVGIYTFHSFCAAVIKENTHLFTAYQELTNASDIDIEEILIEVIDNIPLENPIKRLTGDIYFDSKRLKQLFSLMKRERWSPEFIQNKIDEYRNELMEDPMSKSSRKPYNIKVEVIRELESFSFAYHAAPFIDTYATLLEARGLMDFQDMINMVIDKFKEDKNLLARYQEQYQFILADEYQDTNGSQNDLLFALALNEIDEKPNLFVVGDDDQAIYAFQGANIANITMVKNKLNPKIIVLEDNYRSHQSILDTASKLIGNNMNRLVNIDGSLSKTLYQRNTKLSDLHAGVHLYKYETIKAHDTAVVEKIEYLISSGVAPNEIAVIYKAHKESHEIARYLLDKGIPINLKKKLNVLDQTIVEQIISLIKYIASEAYKPYSQDTALFQILYFHYLGVDPQDIARMSLFASRISDDKSDDEAWRDLINSKELLLKANVTDSDKILQVGIILRQLTSDLMNDTPQVFFEKLLQKTGIFSYMLLSADNKDIVGYVNSIFEFIKNETARNPKITILDIVERFAKMQKFNISLPYYEIYSREEGVNLMTAHGSKGLEFEHVILLNCTDTWTSTRSVGPKLTLPPNINFAGDESSEEEKRRLFFVALTRAKKQVYLMLPLYKEDSKATKPAVFLTELEFDLGSSPIQVADVKVVAFSLSQMKYKQGKMPVLDENLINRVVSKLNMNATGLYKYLNCPLTFYFENILRAPSARTVNIGFGNALHEALDTFVFQINSSPDRVVPSELTLVDLFCKKLFKFKSHFTDEEFKNSQLAGTNISTRYHHHMQGRWSGMRTNKNEYSIRTQINEIPVSGLIDRIDIYDDHIDVVDYKTGRFDNQNHFNGTEKEKIGKYWLQGVFYQMLLEADTNSNWNKKINVRFEYIAEKDKIKEVRSKEPYTYDEISYVKKVLSSAYEGIKAHKFDGCGDSNCKWCNFTQKNIITDSNTRDIEDIDDEYEYNNNFNEDDDDI